MGEEHGAGPGTMAGRQDPGVRGQNKGIEGPGGPRPAEVASNAAGPILLC